MHFYESSIITTKDGLHCQVYANEHPTHSILVKPKYIPTEKVETQALQYRFIGGKKMNRLNLWAEKEALKKYVQNFKEQYPHYVFESTIHTIDEGDASGGLRLFFSIPIGHIERVFFPRTGLSELMSMPVEALDEHLKTVVNFVQFLIKSGLRVKDLGITYSTLMGHYMSNISDINIVVYGKENYWTLMRYLETAEHSLLRWKTKEEWLEFYKKRNRFSIFSQEQFLKSAVRKKSEGYFNDTLFVLFATEKEEEVSCKWGSEKYVSHGIARVQGEVLSNFNSVVRPGFFELKSSVASFNGQDIDVKSVMFYSRDYCMLALPGEHIEALGILEEVIPAQGERYYRIVVGYFDSYVSERREKECIRLIS
jgi:predicted nucleotidyltransferase